MKIYFKITLVWLIFLSAIATVSCGGGGVDGVSMIIPPTPSSYEWLKNMYNKYHKDFYVYDDFDSAGNNFYVRNLLTQKTSEAEFIPYMEESSEESPMTGLNSIKCKFLSRVSNWGVWQFQNGFAPPAQNNYQVNWGEKPNAGVNLSGATELAFYAKGSSGGERVEFFIGGTGYDSKEVKIQPYPDSTRKISTGFITLSNQWQQYRLNLSGADLSYIINGFSWGTSAAENGNKDITFYLDDIKYNLDRTTKPHFGVSYEYIKSNNDIDHMFRNASFTYDNCLMAMAFLASNDNAGAKIILDSILAVAQHDRYYQDGRIGSLYVGGELFVPPGWLTAAGVAGTVRLPGYWNFTTSKYDELPKQNNHHAGDSAWVILALAAYGLDKDPAYLDEALKIGNFVEANLKDTRGAGGYKGGFHGWESEAYVLQYKSTENNIDLYAAFKSLFKATGDTRWLDRSNYAKTFVIGMYDTTENKFWTGTDVDGVTVNKTVIPEDCQSWAVLALDSEDKSYRKALNYAELNHRVGNFYDFNTDRDGAWYEGSAHMAVAYDYIGETDKANTILNALDNVALNNSGALPAADHDGVTTGFTGDYGPWNLYKRNHTGATAFYILAQKHKNPFLWTK